MRKLTPSVPKKRVDSAWDNLGHKQECKGTPLVSQQQAAQKKVLIEFGTAQKITKSTQPFLWQKLIYENTTLKSRVSELTNEVQMMKLRYQKKVRQLCKQLEGAKIASNQPQKKIQELQEKVRELEDKLSKHRLKSTRLQMTYQDQEVEKQQFAEFVDTANYKFGRVGEMEQQIIQLRQQKKVYKQKNNESMMLSFKEKFPYYHETVFQTLELFKRFERFRSENESGQSSVMLRVLKTVTKGLSVAVEKVSDWVQFAFYGKVAYHPSNLQLVEVMLEKWRNSSQSELHSEVRLRQKQLAELTRQYESLCSALEAKQRYISKLEGNLHVTLERNRELEVMVKYNAHDFAYTLFYKLKRWEDDNRVSIPEILKSQLACPASSSQEGLIQYQMLHLKKLLQTLKAQTEFNKNFLDQEEQQQQLIQRKQVEKHVASNKGKLGKPRRSVVVLKKNVYGYWEDPVFNVCKPKPRRQYQRTVSKFTQTSWENQERNRLFFRVTVYNGNLRVTNIKIDPYIKLLYSLIERRTAIKSGRQPFWNQGFTFQQAQPFLTVQLYDKNKLGRDTFMGKATVDLSKIFLQNDIQEIRVEAKIQDETKGFIGRVWLGFAMLERQKIIHVEQIEAQIDVQTDVLGEIDPFLQFKLQQLVVDKTPVLRNAGRKPTWRQQFLILVKDSDQEFGLDLIDQDTMVDDFIGSGKTPISEIPEDQQQMEIQINSKEQKKVGIVKFRIYCRVYINSNIKKRQPYLQAMQFERRVYFWVGQAKMCVENYKSILSPTFYYTVVYGLGSFTSKTSKGMEPFWPSHSTFLAQQHNSLLAFSVFEKSMTGEHKPVTNPITSDISLFLDSNFMGKEKIECKTDKGLFTFSIENFQQMEVVFIKMVRVEFTKKLPRGKLDISIQGLKFGLSEKGGFYQWQSETAIQVALDEEKDKLKVELLQGYDLIASSSITTSSILEEFISEFSVDIKSKGETTGKLQALIGRHTFKNILKARPKQKIRLSLAPRIYYRLTVQRAILTRDTEVFGQMKCFCRILYSSKQFKTLNQPGKNPVWDSSYLLSLIPEVPLVYEVYDQQTIGKDDEVGKGSLDLQKYLQRGIDEIIGPLYHKEESSGTVFFSIVPIPLQYVLVVSHIRAELYDDTDWVGKIDPFVDISVIDKIVLRTTILQGHGQNPHWNVQLQLEVQDPKAFQLVATFKDDDIIGSDFLGKAIFKLDMFSEFFCQIEAHLLKDGQCCGKVYLTAAYNKFVNNIQTHTIQKKVPPMFESMQLKQLQFGELKGPEEMDDAYLVYSYPFQRRTPQKDGFVIYPYVSDTLLVQPTPLRIQAYSKNMLGRSVLRNTFTIEVATLEDKKNNFQLLDLEGSKQRPFSLKLGLSDVELMWVCYFQQIEVSHIEKTDDLTITISSAQFHQEIQLKNGKFTSGFWVFCPPGQLISIQLHQQSILSRTNIGRISIPIELFSIQKMEWRDFEFQSISSDTNQLKKDYSNKRPLISVHCARKMYQKPYNFKCQAASQTPSDIVTIKIDKVVGISEGQILITSNVKIEKKPIQEGVQVYLQNHQTVKFLTQNKQLAQREASSFIEKDNEYVFLFSKNTRVGVVKCTTVSAQTKSLCLIKDFRIFIPQDLTKSQYLEFKIQKGDISYQTKALVGRHCYFNKLIYFIDEQSSETISVTFSVHVQGRTVIKKLIQLKFQPSCYFQNKINQQGIQGYYSVAHYPNFIKQTSFKNQLESGDVEKDIQIFKLEQIMFRFVQKSGIQGKIKCVIQYGQLRIDAEREISQDNQVQLIGPFTLKRINSINTLIVSLYNEKSDKSIAEGKLSLEDCFKLSSRHLIQRSIQINSGRYNIGTTKLRFSFIEEMEYSVIKMKKCVIWNQFKIPTYSLRCGLLSIINRPLTKINEDQYCIHHPIELFTLDPIRFQVNEGNHSLGQVQLLCEGKTAELRVSQFNGFIEYTIEKGFHNRLHSDKTENESDSSEMQVVSIQFERLLLAHNSKVFFQLESQSHQIRSEHIQVKQNKWEGKWKVNVRKGQLSILRIVEIGFNDERVCAQCTIDTHSNASFVLILMNDSKEEVGALFGSLAAGLKNYVLLSSLEAGYLRSTELLASMTPYAIITAPGYCFRTRTSIGRNSLSWQTCLILPQSVLITIKIRDKDMLFDDDVGEASFQLIAGTSEHQIKTIKNAKAGKIKIQSKKIKNLRSVISPQKKETLNYRISDVKVQTFQHNDAKYRGDVFIKFVDQGIQKVCMPISRKAEIVYFSNIISLTSREITVQLVSSKVIATQDVIISEEMLRIPEYSCLMCIEMTSLNNSRNKVGKLNLYVDYLRPLFVIPSIYAFIPSKSKSILQLICLPTATGVYKSRESKGRGSLNIFEGPVLFNQSQNFELLIFADGKKSGFLKVPQQIIKVGLICQQIQENEGLVWFKLEQQQLAIKQIESPKLEKPPKQWIKLNVIKAELTKDLEVIGQMDPYCTIRTDDAQLKTTVLLNVGKKPVWNQVFVFIDTPSLELTVFDSQPINDRIIGSCKIKLSDFKEKEVIVCEVTQKKESTGKLFWSFEIISKYLVLTGFQLPVPGTKLKNIRIKQASNNIDMNLPKRLDRFLITIPLTDSKLQIIFDEYASQNLLIEDLNKNQFKTLILLNGRLFLRYQIFK